MFDLDYLESYKSFDLYHSRETGEILIMQDSPTNPNWSHIAGLTVPDYMKPSTFIPVAKSWIDVYLSKGGNND